MGNFNLYKGLKLNTNFVYMDKLISENSSNKAQIISSILPKGLITYLDIGLKVKLQEISYLKSQEFENIKIIIFEICSSRIN